MAEGESLGASSGLNQWTTHYYRAIRVLAPQLHAQVVDVMGGEVL